MYMISSFLYLFLLINTTKLLANATLLDIICCDTEDESFCINVVSSDPRTKTATLPELAQITLDIATQNATSTIAKIRSLVASERNPVWRQRFRVCQSWYSEALLGLKLAEEDIKQKDYQGFNSQVVFVYKDVYECDSELQKPPGFKKSPIDGNNNDLRRLSNIMTIISFLFASLPPAVNMEY